MIRLGLPACGLGGYGGPEVPAGRGRVAVSWRQSGAPLTAEACEAAGITHMDVQVTALATGQQVTFTERLFRRAPARHRPVGRAHDSGPR